MQANLLTFMLVCSLLFAFICTNSRPKVVRVGSRGTAQRGWLPRRLGRTGASSTLEEHPFRESALKVAPGVSPEPFGLGRRTLSDDIEALRAVGAEHFAHEAELPDLEAGEARDRRAARALELGQEGPLGRQRYPSLAVR